MCCQTTQSLQLPPAVIETLAHYRRLADQRGSDWGDDQIPFASLAHFSLIGPVFAALMTHGDWTTALRSVITDPLPAGLVVITLHPGGHLQVRHGRARLAIPDHTARLDVIIDSTDTTDHLLHLADQPYPVPAGQAVATTIQLPGSTPSFPVTLNDQTRTITEAVSTRPAATLHLQAPECVRWSVTDDRGGAWFPPGLLPKWDVHHRPFFHGHDLTLAVPAEGLHITCTKGLEYQRLEQDAHPTPGTTHPIHLAPRRLIDPAGDGWYGGDLHIHMNYSGDLVCTPQDAARMQHGEGLHLANLVAANSQTSLIYDRQLLEATAGGDLPWSGGDMVARMGVEYRNDLLGHLHALDPSAPPSRYNSGHERSAHPEDWPPNSVACQELRGLGATVGYAHPAFTAFDQDWSTETFFQFPRSVEARELVADAALGLVDDVEILSPFNDEGAIFLYHRLLSCGLRLAATAGTDTFLSFSHMDLASNPPGWARVYAHLAGQELSVAAFKDAIRAGRTMVTNGPWLEVTVNGHGPGSVLDCRHGDQLQVQASVRGAGAAQLTLVGPDGVLAQDQAPDGQGELTANVPVDGPMWIAAIARGPGHPNILDAAALAHTTPVHIQVDGARVARRADATWCLGVLDTLEAFVAAHGHFTPARRSAQLADFTAVLEAARAFYRQVQATAPR